jgi:predicted amidohydrolase
MDVQGGPEAVLAAFAPHVARAAAEGAGLVVFPEYVLGNFKVPDATTEGVRALAREHRINVIAGGWEFLGDHPVTVPPEPGTYANSALIVNREGIIVGRHHKMYAAVGDGSPHFWPPAPGERGEHTMVLGGPSPVVDLDFGRVAVLTCYDGYFFSSFESPALRGAEVLVWINGRGGAVEEHIVRTASFMTCSHVVATNQSVGAGTQICAYPGQVLATATAPGDAFLVAELDLAALRIARRNNRMFHQRRPELLAPLSQPWTPWSAYPELPFFAHPARD